MVCSVSSSPPTFAGATTSGRQAKQYQTAHVHPQFSANPVTKGLSLLALWTLLFPAAFATLPISGAAQTPQDKTETAQKIPTIFGEPITSDSGIKVEADQKNKGLLKAEWKLETPQTLVEFLMSFRIHLNKKDEAQKYLSEMLKRLQPEMIKLAEEARSKDEFERLQAEIAYADRYQEWVNIIRQKNHTQEEEQEAAKKRDVALQKLSTLENRISQNASNQLAKFLNRKLAEAMKNEAKGLFDGFPYLPAVAVVYIDHKSQPDRQK